MIKYHARNRSKWKSKIFRKRTRQRPDKHNNLWRMYILGILCIFLLFAIWQKWHYSINRTRRDMAGINLTKSSFASEHKIIEHKKTSLVWIKPINSTCIIQGYGWQKNEVANEWFFHTGINWEVTKEERVLAVWQGKITELRLEPLGWIVEITHAPNLKSLYKYLTEVNVEKGQSIQANQFLGLCHNNNGEELGLHFAIYKNNEPINPTILWK